MSGDCQNFTSLWILQCIVSTSIYIHWTQHTRSRRIFKVGIINFIINRLFKYTRLEINRIIGRRIFQKRSRLLPNRRPLTTVGKKNYNSLSYWSSNFISEALSFKKSHLPYWILIKFFMSVLVDKPMPMPQVENPSAIVLLTNTKKVILLHCMIYL